LAADQDDKSPPASQRTVFQPSAGPVAPAGSPPGGPTPADPGGAAPPAGANWFANAPPPPPPQPAQHQTSSYGEAKPAPGGGRIPLGSVLNHIYEVRRFIGRGGMGEVYEGVNVNTDERVAIKVILEHLAQDPKVQALFRAEANVLTRLTHEALVQYRLMAREPTLDVLYIVTDFVDGTSCEDLIGDLRLSEPELVGLIHRLAEGLAAAHARNVYHRDISPDNILLPERRLDSAKIIDFGIAKDLQTSQATIIGAGFAGKLNFVAPEQLGDFGRNIGPWTDIYSLGLVMLSLAAGKQVDMGSTLSEAVDRRRAPPDLSALPESLRPIFARMLAGNPADRFQSMDELLAALEPLETPSLGRRRTTTAPGLESAPAAPAAAPTPTPAPAAVVFTPSPRVAPSTPPPAPPPPSAPRRTASSQSMRIVLLAAGGVAILVLTVGLTVAFMSHKGPSTPDHPTGVGIAATPATPTNLTTIVNQAIANADCAWMDYDINHDEEGAGTLMLTGAAGDPGAAGETIRAAVRKAGESLSFNTRGLAPLAPAACDQVNAFRAFRAKTSGADPWVTPQAADFRPQAHPECRNDPGQALAILEGDMGRGGDDDSAMIVMAPDGELRTVYNGAAGYRNLQRHIASGGATGVANDIGEDRFSVGLCQHMPGIYGVVLVRGRGPFDLGLSPAGVPDGRPQPGDFALRFQRAAKANGWHTQMGWYTVDEGPPAAVQTPQPTVTAPTPQPRTQPQARPTRPVRHEPPARHTRQPPAQTEPQAQPRPPKPPKPPPIHPVEAPPPSSF